MTPRGSRPPLHPDRDRFERRRARLLAAGGVLVACVAAVGVLVAEPRGAGAVRLLGVGIAWWASGLAWAASVVALWIGLRPPRT